MEIVGRVIQVMPEVTGQGKNGEWKKQDFVIETEAQYPKKVCFTVWGDKIDASKMQVGNRLNVSFDVESREYNGRWYTDVKAWRLDMADGMEAGGGAPVGGSSSAAPKPVLDLSNDFKANSGDEDLPF